MEEYLKLLKRRLSRSNDQIDRRLSTDSALLSSEGIRMVGYYQGRVSILEDAIDEIECQLDRLNKSNLINTSNT